MVESDSGNGGGDVSRILTVDQDVVDDPHALAAELRASCPVYREPVHRVVVLTRYDDIVDVARRTQDFSSILAAYGPNGHDRGRVPAALCDIAHRSGTREAAPAGSVEQLLASYVPDVQDQLQHVDPPLHTRHRAIVSRWFTPGAVAEREDAVRAITRTLIDRFATGGRVEIVDALAGPLPATVIADLIDIPVAQRAVFLDWKEEVFGNPHSSVSRATSDKYGTIREVFARFVSERRAEPGDDLISALVTARTRDGDLLDDTAIVTMLVLFLGGGQETTGKALTTALRFLVERHDLQSDLRADPSQIPVFVEEVLRYDPPVKGIFRIAVRDTVVGDTHIPEGSFLQLMWGSGNRDDAAFYDAAEFVPDRFADRSRGDRPSLAFGHGVHLCPGAHLARLQLRVALEELLARFGDIRYGEGNTFEYVHSQILRGLRELWLECDPA